MASSAAWTDVTAVTGYSVRDAFRRVGNGRGGDGGGHGGGGGSSVVEGREKKGRCVVM